MAVLACALGAQAGGAQVARREGEELERPEVVELRLEGVEALPKKEVEDALFTRESGCLNVVLTPLCWVSKSPAVYERRHLDRTEFKRDVIRLLVHYFRRGWRDAAVDTSVTPAGPDKVKVTFKVTEGPPTIVTELTVDDSAGPLPRRGRGRGAGRFLVPRPGEPLNLLRLDSTVARLRSAYWNRGYGNARVEKPIIAANDTANQARVSIPVYRGPLTPIGDIEVVHLDARPRIDDETILNSLLIKPGDLFRADRVGESQRALYESGLFRSAVIDTATGVDGATGRRVCAQHAELREAPRAAPTRPDSVKTVVVCVLEAPPREVRTSVGFTTADFFQVDGRFTHNYWLNSPKRLTLSAIVGNIFAEQLNGKGIFQNVWPADLSEDGITPEARYFAPTYQIGADLTQRWLGNPRNTLSTGLFLRRRSSPGVFVDRGYGASGTFTRDLTPRTPASLSYTFEINRVEAGDVYFCVNYGVCDAPTIAALGGQQRLSPLTLSFSQNTSDSPLAPARGSRLRGELAHASKYTLSDFRYNRAFAEATVYRRIGFRRTVLAARARVGWVNALAGTNEAVGVESATSGVDPEGHVLHPRTRFYAGGSQSVRGFGENQLGPRVLTIDPEKLAAGDDPESPCQPDADPSILAECVNRAGLSDDDFVPRPVGGTTLLEASVEGRMPLFGKLSVAAFIDAAILGERSLSSITEGTSAITPGIGVRYLSPVGPVRVDLGLRPTLREVLPVVTQVGPTSNLRLIDLSTLAPGGRCTTTPSPGCRVYSGGDSFWERLTLHLSIGEAF